jgi:hypothetical protein
MLIRLSHKILGLTLILGSWAGWEQTMPEKSQFNDVELIRQARLHQNDAMAIGNIEAAASFWTEDVTLRRRLGASIPK